MIGRTTRKPEPDKPYCYTNYWVHQVGQTVRITSGALAGTVGRLNGVSYHEGRLTYRLGCQLHAEHRSVWVSYLDLAVVKEGRNFDECNHSPCCCGPNTCGYNGCPATRDHQHFEPPPCCNPTVLRLVLSYREVEALHRLIDTSQWARFEDKQLIRQAVADSVAHQGR